MWKYKQFKNTTNATNIQLKNKYNKLVNITEKRRFTDTENKLEVISGKREGGGAIQG